MKKKSYYVIMLGNVCSCFLIQLRWLDSTYSMTRGLTDQLASCTGVQLQCNFTSLSSTLSWNIGFLGIPVNVIALTSQSTCEQSNLYRCLLSSRGRLGVVFLSHLLLQPLAIWQARRSTQSFRSKKTNSCASSS